jgi:hypothetical protein
MPAAVIFRYPTEYPADDCERLVPDPATARRLVRERRPDLLDLLAHRRQRFQTLIAARPDAPITAAEDAVLMAFCRLAFRHGSWGKDFHSYHNENHIFEILGPRLERLIDAIGIGSLSLRNWFLLALFAAAHDLRQREASEYAAGIGSNERASIEETFRILHLAGFTPERNADVFIAIELMIAGSTFDARPPPSRDYNPAEAVVQSGGALAQKLDEKLDKHVPGWRTDERIAHALDLALIAADLDTANVAERFPVFMASTERLCLEREMRSRRNLDDAVSAQPILNFLTTGQEHYFFDLHRFSSEPGRIAFSAAKDANAGRMRELIGELRRRVDSPTNGTAVLEVFRGIVLELSKPT